MTDKWTCFYSRLLALIWNPLEADRSSGDLMIDMFRMQEFMREYEVRVSDGEFVARFRGSVYWNHVGNICKLEWEKREVGEKLEWE